MNSVQGNAAVNPDSIVSQIFSRDAENPSVCVVDGFGISVSTTAGQLVIKDGIGRSRRERRYAKATHGLARLVIMGSSGNVTIEAIRWLEGVGIGLVVVDPSSGEVVSTSTRVANDDARLRRAQALCPGTETGIEITRFLIGRKLQGQADVLRRYFDAKEAPATIDDLAVRVGDTDTLEEIRTLEASAANLYWASWCELDVPFVKKDTDRVPPHWKTFEGRRSAVNPGSARNSSDPINTLLNYTYRLLEAEGQLATLAVGLDPGLGILHADMKGRPSFVLDLIEAVRPVADAYVLDLLKVAPLQWRDFDEDQRGVVRVLAPLSHRLAEAMPGFATTLGPVAERVARQLAKASPYDFSTPSVLTRDKHRKAARSKPSSGGAKPSGEPAFKGLTPRTKTKQSPRKASKPSLPLPTCQVCGVSLERESDRTRRRGSYCPSCLGKRRAEIGSTIQALPKERREVSPSERVKRSEQNAAARLEQQTWEMDHSGETFDREWFIAEVLPGLQGVTLTEIAKATGMSTSAASKVRAGKRVPHPRHWGRLSNLAVASDHH